MPLIDTFNMAPDQAIKWFNQKGLKESWNWMDVWEEQHSIAFTVAKSMQYDILSDIRDATKQALNQGLTNRQFRAMLTQKLKAKGWWGKKQVINPNGVLQTVQLGSPWRLNTIYQTNMQASMMSGRWKRFWDNKDNRPYLQYIAVMDPSTRHSHAALNGKIFHIEDPIWHTIMPPNGFYCRCRVRALTEKQAFSRGFNPKEKYQLPDGFPDRGFHHNNGISRMALHHKLFKSINRSGGAIVKNLKGYLLYPVILGQYKRSVEHIIQRGAETQGKYRQSINLLAGFLSPALISLLEVKDWQGAVSLHERLIVGKKSKRKSGEQGSRRKNSKATQLSNHDWLILSELMTKPKAIIQEGRAIHFLLESKGKFIRVLVKANRNNSPEVASVSYLSGISHYEAKKYKFISGGIE